MTITIHDTPGYRLELRATEHPRFGTTLELFTTWPQANHPEPHRLLTLTLPRDAFARLAEALRHLADGATA